jgi:DNA-binding MarR family transcriptional regulator
MQHYLMKKKIHDSDEKCPSRDPKGSSSPAFLLAQVGAHAASKFAENLREIELAPAHAGILRILAATPAITQQALSFALGAPPSRLVALVDELESKRFVERHPDEGDRRRYALRLTDKGISTLQSIGRIARAHQQRLLAALSEEEQSELSRLLQRVADQQGLKKGIHPGYRWLRAEEGGKADK